MRLNLPLLLAASMALLNTACSAPVSHGHIHEPDVIAAIKPGTTSKDQVQQMLGSPSSQSSFGLVTWYYISSIQKTRSLLPPKTTEQNVTEIAFDGSGVVSAVKQYTLADGKKVDIETQITPSEGQQLGVFEQILGNLGRFNKDGATTSPTGRHTSTGIPGGPGT